MYSQKINYKFLNTLLKYILGNKFWNTCRETIFLKYIQEKEFRIIFWKYFSKKTFRKILSRNTFRKTIFRNVLENSLFQNLAESSFQNVKRTSRTCHLQSSFHPCIPSPLAWNCRQSTTERHPIETLTKTTLSHQNQTQINPKSNPI